MVILNGLEFVAAGYLLNEFNKDKIEAREHRKHSRPHDDDRPQSRPSRPDSQGPNHLMPPANPPRPLSAPPQQQQYVHDFWQKQEQLAQQQRPPPQYQQQPPNWGLRPQWQPGPQPQAPVNSRPPPPRPGGLQHPSTFHGPQRPPQQPLMQSSNIFPGPPQQLRPSPASVPPQHKPFVPPAQAPVYIDSKTGKVSHNLYPPDHPMARGMSYDNREIPQEAYGDGRYTRAMAGDINTGMVWGEKDGNDLAYGKDYSDRRRHWRDTSYEKMRDRQRSSPPPRY